MPFRLRLPGVPKGWGTGKLGFAGAGAGAGDIWWFREVGWVGAWGRGSGGPGLGNV